jgi:hypothetical protein
LFREVSVGLPFSESQFLDVFALYNQALWPVAFGLWLLTTAVVVAWLAGRPVSDRWVSALLASLWAWGAIAYHFAFFSRINAAARIFGLLFLLEALVFVWWGMVRRTLHFSTAHPVWQALSIGLVLYALAYPFVNLGAGLRFPRMPTFGVPCPTTLLTAGMLLSASPRAPRLVLVIPIVWCLVGGSGAFVLGIRADLVLVLAGIALLARGFARPGPSPGRAA